MLLGLCLAAALMFPPLAAASEPDPIFVPGNPSCVSLGYDFGFKVDPPASGTYNIDGLNTLTVTTDGVSFDWSSTLSVDAVISKGGPNANLYVYDPPAEATSGAGLHSPINPNNGRPFGLSHIEICFDYEVAVSKTAQTSFTRTWRWHIDKSVAPEHWELFEGDRGTSQYTIAVERTGYTDSDWAVSGTISIYNPAPMTATIQSVADVISTGISATVSCGVSLPYALGSGQTLECNSRGNASSSSPDCSTCTTTGCWAPATARSRSRAPRTGSPSKAGRQNRPALFLCSMSFSRPRRPAQARPAGMASWT